MNVLNRKRTKIVATISDKRCDPPFLRELYEAGMDVVRINSAHLSVEGALKIISNVFSPKFLIKFFLMKIKR